MEGGIESLRDRGSYLHVGMLMEGGRVSRTEVRTCRACSFQKQLRIFGNL